jgi:hypothetical protein
MNVGALMTISPVCVPTMILKFFTGDHQDASQHPGIAMMLSITRCVGDTFTSKTRLTVRMLGLQ